MHSIDQKVHLVRRYIHHKKGVDIVNIDLKDGIDLQKLDFAYNVAFNFFYRNNNN